VAAEVRAFDMLKLTLTMPFWMQLAISKQFHGEVEYVETGFAH
jgi:hypothetical protein